MSAYDQTTSDEMLTWIVRFNTDIKVIDMPASSPLALFKQEFLLTFGQREEVIDRLEIKTESGRTLGDDCKSLLDNGAAPGDIIQVSVLPQR